MKTSLGLDLASCCDDLCSITKQIQLDNEIVAFDNVVCEPSKYPMAFNYHNKIIYSQGKRVSRKGPRDKNIYEYDLVSKKSKVIGEMPNGIYYPAYTVHNDTLYLCCGQFETLYGGTAYSRRTFKCDLKNRPLEFIDLGLTFNYNYWLGTLHFYNDHLYRFGARTDAQGNGYEESVHYLDLNNLGKGWYLDTATWYFNFNNTRAGVGLDKYLFLLNKKNASSETEILIYDIEKNRVEKKVFTEVSLETGLCTDGVNLFITDGKIVASMDKDREIETCPVEFSPKENVYGNSLIIGSYMYTIEDSTIYRTKIY